MTSPALSKRAASSRFIRWASWIAASLALLPGLSLAGTDGAGLLARCGVAPAPSTSSNPAEPTRNTETAWCEGYITGLSESHDGMGYCRRTQADLSLGFEREAVQRFLAEHRNRLHEPAATLVLDALRQAFPCLR